MIIMKMRHSRIEQENIRHMRALHKSLIAALALVLVLSLSAPHIEVTNRFELDPADSNLILIALKTVSPKKPDPPKPRVIPPPAVVVKEPEKVPDVIKTKIKPAPKRPRRQRGSETKLNINHNTDLLASNSPSLGDLSGPNAHGQRRGSSIGLPDLDANLLSDRLVNDAGPGGLDIGETKAQARRETAPAAARMNLEIKREPEPEPVATQGNDDDITSFLDADVSLVLTSSDLSMGIEEYQIWNKINAELDRWDKGRYGSLPQSLQRRGRAIVESFQYDDGSAHRCVWLRGNTKLYVLGNSDRNRIAELQQALTAIIHLNTKRGRL